MRDFSDLDARQPSKLLKAIGSSDKYFWGQHTQQPRPQQP